MRKLLLLGLLAFSNITVNAQGYVDQDKVTPLLNSQTGSIQNVRKAQWMVYDYKAFKKGEKKGPWTKLQAYLDSLPGEQRGYRLEIVELANRVTSDRLKPGRKLVVPVSFD